MPRAVLGQKGLNPRILRFRARGGPAGQAAKCKKVAQFLGQNFGADVFFPPSSGKLHFSVFRPGIFPSAKGCPRPKGPRKPVFHDFPPLGSGRPKRKKLKSCAIPGRNFWGGRISPQKVPLAPGSCVFLFLACGPNRANHPVNHRFTV